MYNAYLGLEAQQGIHTLRIRFLLLFFYDLYSCFVERTKVRAGSAYKAVAGIILGESPSDHDLAFAIKKVTDLVVRGRRYNKLTKSFGNRVLLELPVYIGRDL